jgi:shikimate kinase
MNHLIWKRNLVLVGFMGAGKSTIGHSLVDQFALELTDTDVVIAARFGLSIPEIFSTLGEIAFRDAESELLEELQETRGQVVATGGGIVMKDENWRLMRRIGPVIFLNVSPQVLKERLAGETGRPLADGLQWDEILERYEKRLPHYLKADIVVEADHDTPEPIIDNILKSLEQKNILWKF